MLDRLPLLDARRVPRLAFAPRLDPRLHRALARIDDPSRPTAETYRRLAGHARTLGLFRPSYEHVRRLVQIIRRLRDLQRAQRRETALVLFEAAYNLQPPSAFVDHLLDAGQSRPP
jgi:hypothetical protein